jgi:hypothetical protein
VGKSSKIPKFGGEVLKNTENIKPCDFKGRIEM